MVHQNGPTTNPIRVPRTRIVLVELGIDSTLFFPERQKIIDLFSKSFDHDTENREIDEKKWKWTSYANRTVKINCPEKCNADVKTSDYHLVQKRFDPNWGDPESVAGDQNSGRCPTGSADSYATALMSHGENPYKNTRISIYGSY